MEHSPKVVIKNESAAAASLKPNETHAPCKPSTAKPVPGLYVIATPIGNMRDLTLRAVEVLRGSGIVLCEDTRVTRKLFTFHQIDSPLLAYHEHNAKRVRPLIMERLNNGESVALVSDAGTPLISDPGYRLVEACIAGGIALTTLPGASSVMCALVLSGLPTDRFFFQGFLPNRAGPRRRALAEITGVPGSLVFLESAKRLAACLQDMADILGPRQAAVTRELTKLYEEVRRGSLAELAAHYGSAGPPKGEITLVVGPAAERQPPDGETLDRIITDRLKTDSVKETATALARELGIPRRQIYGRAIELKGSPG